MKIWCVVYKCNVFVYLKNRIYDIFSYFILSKLQIGKNFGLNVLDLDDNLKK